jgi:predicted outer membrane repeat protein
MSVKFVKTAARIVAAGAVMALGVASAPAALAAPALVTVQVPCNATALAADIAGATSGETLNLTVPCVYVLTEALPVITTNLTITGGGFATLERSFAPETPAFSILAVDTDVNVVIDHVNFRNGDAGLGCCLIKTRPGIKARPAITPAATTGSGGAIDNAGGNVTVNGGVFTGNTAGESGGAIYNDNQLRVIKATFNDNTATFGGAIENDNVATVNGGTFFGNAASSEGGGFYTDEDATVTGATFRHNSAEYGGGVYNDGTVTLAGDTFLGNAATDDEGGGLYNDDVMTVTGALFQHNLAVRGGGIYNDSVITVRGSRILHNTASTGGGGIFNDFETVNLFASIVNVNTPDNCEPLNSIGGCVN